MRSPAWGAQASVSAALVEMTQKSLGMTAVVDAHNRVIGIYTDGDLRRTLDTEANLKNTLMHDVMTANCITITADMLAAEAVNIMQEKAIFALLVVDDGERLCGALHMHDLLRAGVL